jgi:hypothetical protein
MEKNVGGYDRIARLVLGPILAIVGGAQLLGYVTIAAGTLGLAVGVVAMLVGLVFVATGAVQKCPLNSLLGFDTYRPKTEADELEAGPGRVA